MVDPPFEVLDLKSFTDAYDGNSVFPLSSFAIFSLAQFQFNKQEQVFIVFGKYLFKHR